MEHCESLECRVLVARVVVDVRISVGLQLFGNEVDRILERLLFSSSVMSPEWCEALLAVLYMVEAEQVLEATGVERIPLHIKEDISHVRARYASEPLCRPKRQNLTRWWATIAAG